MTRDPLEIALLFTKTLEELDVVYAIVGSVASSAYGEPRATMDVDLLVDLAEADARPLCPVPPFWVDTFRMRESPSSPRRTMDDEKEERQSFGPSGRRRA